MSKQATPRALAEHEAKATVRMLRVSPRKLNLVAQLIRGKKITAALAAGQVSASATATPPIPMARTIAAVGGRRISS